MSKTSTNRYRSSAPRSLANVVNASGSEASGGQGPSTAGGGSTCESHSVPRSHRFAPVRCPAGGAALIASTAFTPQTTRDRGLRIPLAQHSSNPLVCSMGLVAGARASKFIGKMGPWRQILYCNQKGSPMPAVTPSNLRSARARGQNHQGPKRVSRELWCVQEDSSRALVHENNGAYARG